MISVAEINDIDRIDHFRLAWRSLLGKTKGATFAHSPEWLEQYWSHFGRDLKLRVLFVTLQNKVIGIVPLVVKPVSTPLGTLRVLTYPLDSWGSFYGQIGGNPAATMVTAMRHIRSSRRDWDLIDFRYIDQDGHDHQRTSNAFKSVGFQGSQQIWRQLPVINTENTSWNEYFASRSARTRKLIEDALDTTAQDGHVSFYRSQLEDPLAPGWNPRWDLWTQFEKMNFQSGKRLLLAGGTCSLDQKLNFLRDIHGPASRSGSARIDALFVNHSLTALAYGLQHAEGTDYLALGRSPDAPPEAVTALIAQMVQQSIMECEPALNLGLLGLSNAGLWKNQIQTSYRCSHFPITVPRAQLVRLNRWMQQPVQKPKTSRRPATSQLTAATEGQRSSIELAASAPDEWPEEKSTSANTGTDRPPFRIVG